MPEKRLQKTREAYRDREEPVRYEPIQLRVRPEWIAQQEDFIARMKALNDAK